MAHVAVQVTSAQVYWSSASLKSLVEMQLGFSRLGWGLRFRISNKVPEDASTAGPGPQFGQQGSGGLNETSEACIYPSECSSYGAHCHRCTEWAPLAVGGAVSKMGTHPW